MGNCFSKYREKKTKKRNEEEFDEIKNNQTRATKGTAHRKESDDSDSHSSSSPDAQPAKVRRSKKISRQENGGLVVVSKKTIVGGDIIKVEGSKIVNITTGGRRSRENEKRDRGQDSSRQNGVPVKPGKPTRVCVSKLSDWENSPPRSLLPKTIIGITGTTNVCDNGQLFSFPKSEAATNPQPPCRDVFLQLADRRVLVLDQRHLLEVAKSVGKVCAGDYCGTCFRVGQKYVMTARHVVMDIVNNGIISLGPQQPTSFAALNNEDVYVNFDFLSRNTTTIRKFYLTSNVVFEDEVLDIAVVELKAAREFPPPFRNFGQAQPNSKFTFVGHPFGEPKQMNQVDGLSAVSTETKAEAVAWSREVASYDGFAGMETSGRIMFHCSFQKGGSGSPGIAVVGEQAVVVTVLLHGYPDWFYDPNFDQDIKNRVANQQRIEQGVSMIDLHYKIHEVNSDLCNEIFARANE